MYFWQIWSVKLSFGAIFYTFFFVDPLFDVKKNFLFGIFYSFNFCFHMWKIYVSWYNLWHILCVGINLWQIFSLLKLLWQISFIPILIVANFLSFGMCGRLYVARHNLWHILYFQLPFLSDFMHLNTVCGTFSVFWRHVWHILYEKT